MPATDMWTLAHDGLPAGETASEDRMQQGRRRMNSPVECSWAVFDGQRRHRHQSIAAYVAGYDTWPAATARASLGTCTAACCQRLAARPGCGLCGAHNSAWRLAGSPELAAFRRAASPCRGDRTGRVALA